MDTLTQESHGLGASRSETDPKSLAIGSSRGECAIALFENAGTDRAAGASLDEPAQQALVLCLGDVQMQSTSP
jgi:hypothetical protein